jgi:hypothetical protein
MQAVKSHTIPVGSEVLIAPRRPVAANNLNFGVLTSKGNSDFAKQIKNPRIVVVNLAGTVVTQAMIDLRDGAGIVGAPVTVLDVKPFTGVRVKKT